ncbi:MAG: carbamoyltransferase HypF [Woeseiaceae bacterium]|nr:carbamoyltransferase HypF [Woeseiaceae bacterium]
MQNASRAKAASPDSSSRADEKRSGADRRALRGQRALKITLGGQVQGVGFRPFVHRLANDYELTGQVQNRLGEVEVIACGHQDQLQLFCRDIVLRAPPLAEARVLREEWLDNVSYIEFNIAPSSSAAPPRVFLPPDYFMCDDCLGELGDPEDRRYNYPFINCTQCGPRYTLIESLPYDRPNTSMADFPLCADCLAEYANPADRRFHAEPVACPECGPVLTYVGQDAANSTTALDGAVRSIRNGETIAVKGIGGYHLLCDALNPAAVTRLRERKRRPDKPLAVMFPVAGGDGLDYIRRYAKPDDVEAAMIRSPERPIVLLRKQPGTDLAPNIAPGLTAIGTFLPYSPLHQLLLAALGRPLVATSGNISGEPVLIDNDEAERNLSPIVDGFLHHDRRIVRPADDSVYREIAGAMRPLRMGRGRAPCEFELPWRQQLPTLAVGGQMKGAIALSWENRIVVSPHIGEMDSPRSLAVFEQLVEDLQALYRVRAKRIVCDAHPGYTTHRWAHRQVGMAVETAWHHHAHASALAAEFELQEECLVFTWDGVGLGDDGSLWGGEALLGLAGRWQRVASLRPFRLPGGERAGREPWRSAAALMWENNLPWPGCPDTTDLARTAWQAGLNCPTTTAAGRLFDAAAALVLGVHEVSYEAAGPMQLEAMCRRSREPLPLPLARDNDGIWRSDWAPLLAMCLDQQLDVATRAEMFHASLSELILQQARAVRDDHAFSTVGLCGGVFQNRVLAEQVIDKLHQNGFDVRLPSRLPCNDAALCVGQAAEFAARTARIPD